MKKILIIITIVATVFIMVVLVITLKKDRESNLLYQDRIKMWKSECSEKGGIFVSNISACISKDALIETEHIHLLATTSDAVYKNGNMWCKNFPVNNVICNKDKEYILNFKAK